MRKYWILSINNLLTTLLNNLNKMKKLLIVIMLIIPIALLAQNASYTLKGKVGNLNAPAKVYLTYRNTSSTVVDSTTIQNGQFEFKGTINDPIQAILVLSYKGAGMRSKPSQHLTIYLEPGNINISSPDSLVHATITGSKINSDNENLKDALKATDKKNAALMLELKALPVDKQRDKNVVADFQKRQDVIIEEQNKVQLDFIRKNPNSFVSLDLLKAVFGPN